MVKVILKKPYAFLIKRFRLIHLILAAVIAFLIVKTLGIYNFFDRYVTNVYATLSDSTPSNYVTIFMFLVTVIIIAVSMLIYFLMRKKDKPRTFYVILSVYYLLFFLGLIGYFMLFKAVESSNLSIRDAMLYRDLTIIVILPQFIFLIFAIIRGIGFDIKKFNFSKDLKDLDISDEDSEEFEFVLGTDSYKYTRFARRRLREFKYYILENKFMFTILTGLVLAIAFVMFILHFTVYNKTYNKNQKFYANNLAIQVNNSYLTNLDYTGKPIEDGKYFLVVNTTFTNSSGYTTVLNLSSYVLETKNENVYPTLSRNNYFVDLGAGYAKEKIESGSSATYILVYELNNSQLSNKYNLKIIDEVDYKAGTMHSKTKNVSLRPKTYYNIETVGEYEVGTPVTMYESILNNSTLLINSYAFQSKYTYKYEACIRNNCRDVTDAVTADATKNKTLLVLSGSLEVDSNSAFAKNLKTVLSFFDAFVQIRYDDKISTVTNATPNSVLEQYILQVDKNAENAKSLDLVITVRDKKYIINLK